MSTLLMIIDQKSHCVNIKYQIYHNTNSYLYNNIAILIWWYLVKNIIDFVHMAQP